LNIATKHGKMDIIITSGSQTVGTSVCAHDSVPIAVRSCEWTVLTMSDRESVDCRLTSTAQYNEEDL